MKWDEEKSRQESFPWTRSGIFPAYNQVLGHYQVQACLEHAHGESLLDIPCGDGTLTKMLALHFKRVLGVDASGKHLQVAKRVVPSAEFRESLIETFDTPERFDTVTMLNVLEHLQDPVAVLARVSRFLSSNGVLLAHVPNALAVNRRLGVLMGTLTHCEELSPFDIQVAGHRRSYTLESLQRDVVKAGLQVRATGGVFYKELSTPQMDWFLSNGLWSEGGFGWGRLGGPQKDWRAEFCRACYELGKTRPEDCNIIYACATL